MPTLEAIKYSRGRLEIIDQLELPHNEIYREITTASEAWNVIKAMQVRGAPAIAIVAALGLAVELSRHQADPSAATSARTHISDETTTCQATAGYITRQLEYLVTSRPTAVNLTDAAKKLSKVVATAAQRPDATPSDVMEAYVVTAERMLVDDVQDNQNIGTFGAEWIAALPCAAGSGKQVTVLTHCNTGSLATAGYGTALGIVRSLEDKGCLRQAYYTETRPYNQGSRLTGYELIYDQIPATLITDSMAASLFRLKAQSENIAAVIVGADRVAANGDTANKIGTYALAVLARFHNVKFVVAAPRTTIDRDMPSGESIVIEERPPHEMTSIKGPLLKTSDDGTKSIDRKSVVEVSIAALGTQAFNPAFDVTPAALIDAIVTEKGVIEKGADGIFHFESILKDG